MQGAHISTTWAFCSELLGPIHGSGKGLSSLNPQADVEPASALGPVRLLSALDSMQG